MTLSLSLRLLSVGFTTFGLLGLTPSEEMANTRSSPRSAPAQERKQLSVMRIDKAEDGLFYVVAKVNAVPIRFVVDTGSNMVVLTAVDAARAGVIKGAAVTARTAGGTAMARRAVVQRFELNGHRFHLQHAIVTEGITASLMGQNVLERLESVTLHGDRLDLR